MRANTRDGRITDDTGVVSLELALILPFLLLLIFGIVQFGRAYNTKVELTGAVREGARVFALHSGDPETATPDAAPGYDAASMHIECGIGATVQPCTTSCGAGDEVWVQVAYDFDLEIPFFPGSGTIPVYAKGVMRCGG